MFLEKYTAGLDMVNRFDLIGLRQIIENVCNHCMDAARRVHKFFPSETVEIYLKKHRFRQFLTEFFYICNQKPTKMQHSL